MQVENKGIGISLPIALVIPFGQNAMATSNFITAYRVAFPCARQPGFNHSQTVSFFHVDYVKQNDKLAMPYLLSLHGT